jgi:hypothetical protein
MLFNDDERRFYYEGIPVPGTEDFFDMTKEQQAQAKYERAQGLLRLNKELEGQKIMDQNEQRAQRKKPAISDKAGNSIKDKTGATNPQVTKKVNEGGSGTRKIAPLKNRTSQKIPSNQIPGKKPVTQNDAGVIEEPFKAISKDFDQLSVTGQSSMTAHNSVTGMASLSSKFETNLPKQSSRFKPNLLSSASTTNPKGRNRLQNKSKKIGGKKDERFPDLVKDQNKHPSAE